MRSNANIGFSFRTRTDVGSSATGKKLRNFFLTLGYSGSGKIILFWEIL